MSGKRQVIEVEGPTHRGQPIPLAVRRGPVLVTGSISGRSRSTGELPERSPDEIGNAFANMRAILDEAGLSLDCVVKVEVSLSDMELRRELNEVWLELFPDEADRPVRHTTKGSLPAGLRIQLSILAVE